MYVKQNRLCQTSPNPQEVLFPAFPPAVKRSFDGYQAVDRWLSNDCLMPSGRFLKPYKDSISDTVCQGLCRLFYGISSKNSIFARRTKPDGR